MNVLYCIDRFSCVAASVLLTYLMGVIDMELRYGILQVAEALFYLHATERLLHLNVCPQNVIVTKRGMWKLSGLCFTQNIGAADLQSNVREPPRPPPTSCEQAVYQVVGCYVTRE